MRVGVLGNCQAQGIADSVRTFVPGSEVELRLLVGFNPADGPTASLVIEDMLRCDVVFVQVLEFRRPELKPLITALIEAHPKPVRFPVVAFRGFHPDCGHVRRGGAQVPGPLGPYHSMLACAGWLEGLNPARTAALFNAFGYAALGYFDVYAQARDVLTEQAKSMGFDVSAWFEAGAPRFMHTVNHPTSAALHDLARQILDLAGIGRSDEASLPPDHLAEGPIWPFYPELARRITPDQATEDSCAFSSARPLVDATYRSLESDLQSHGPLDFEGPSQPNGSHIRRARAFLREFVVK
jgi:hypothetical protein